MCSFIFSPSRETLDIVLLNLTTTKYSVFGLDLQVGFLSFLQQNRQMFCYKRDREIENKIK